MATAGYSYSAVKKARTYLAAALEYAVGERIIQVNPGNKVDLPGAKLRNLRSAHTALTRSDGYFQLHVRCRSASI
jgi:hypothetical protein